jgi:hypothetical protein
MAHSIRIDQEDHETLKSISRKTRRPMADLLGDAIAELKKRFILEATLNGYRNLQEDDAAWQAEQEEQALWDTAATSDAHTEGGA